jgi:hypothetical protein
MKRILNILLLFFLTLPVIAQVSVSAALDSTSIMIGDQVNITLSMSCGPDVEFQDLDISALDTVKSLELMKIGDLQEVSKSDAGRLLQQKITITSFTEGVYLIPQIRIPYKKDGKDRNVYTSTLQLKVNTFDVGEATELQPIKNIIDEPITLRDYLPFMLVAVSLVLLGFLIWYLIKRSRKKEAFGEFEKKKLPAHVIALKKLGHLAEEELWQKGAIKRFQSELTFILREYLEDRFDIRALESTSDEIVADLKNADIDQERTEKLKNILQTADLVKFAKSEPPIEVHDQAFQNIMAFVKETIPQVAEEEDNLETGGSTETGNTKDD